jgi:hypothetical protein
LAKKLAKLRRNLVVFFSLSREINEGEDSIVATFQKKVTNNEEARPHQKPVWDRSENSHGEGQITV